MAAGHIIEAPYQVNQCRFAGSGGTDDGNGLSWVGGEIDVAQYQLVLRHRLGVFAIVASVPTSLAGIREVDVVQDHLPLDGRHLVRIFGVHQVKRFIQQVEDALAGRQCCLKNGVDLADLLDWAEELLHIAQEGHHHAHRRQPDNSQVAAEPHDNGNGDGAEHVHSRRKGRSNTHRAHIGISVGGVEFCKPPAVRVLTAESLRHPHPGDLLLQLHVHVTDGLAGFAESGPGALGQKVDDQHHHRDDRKAGQRQLPVEHDHSDHDGGHLEDAA